MRVRPRRRFAAAVAAAAAVCRALPKLLPLLDDAALKRALLSCLDDLHEGVREAVLLRYQQGFSFEAMSELCKEKAGTLQARVVRAVGRDAVPLAHRGLIQVAGCHVTDLQMRMIHIVRSQSLRLSDVDQIHA